MKGGVLGRLLGVGLIVQILLGFALASNYVVLVDLHVLIGTAGLLVVGFLLRESWIQRNRFGWSGFAVVLLLLVLVFLQVYLGSVLLTSSSDALAPIHEANALLILILGIVISVMGRRRRKELELEFRSSPSTAQG